MKWLRNTAADDTTSEPYGRNAIPVAPVIAPGHLVKLLSRAAERPFCELFPMSGSEGCNQGGTVEYIRIPPLIFQGVGIFFGSSDKTGKS